MDITNLDIIQTRELIQEKVKSGHDVTFQGVTVLKMNFTQFFYIVEDQVATRIFFPEDQKEFKLVADQIQVDGQPLQIVYSENPVLRAKGTCPVCNGSGSVNSSPCNNCGGQYNAGASTGVTILNDANQPCTHDYVVDTIRNSYTQYRCQSCADTYFKTL